MDVQGEADGPCHTLCKLLKSNNFRSPCPRSKAPYLITNMIRTTSQSPVVPSKSSTTSADIQAFGRSLLDALPQVAPTSRGPVGIQRNCVQKILRSHRLATARVRAGNLSGAAKASIELVYATGAQTWLHHDGSREFRAEGFTFAHRIECTADQQSVILRVMATLATRIDALRRGELLTKPVGLVPSAGDIRGAVVATIPRGAGDEPWRAVVGGHLARWTDFFAVVALGRHAQWAARQAQSQSAKTPLTKERRVASLRCAESQQQLQRRVGRELALLSRGAKVLLPVRYLVPPSEAPAAMVPSIEKVLSQT